jgi:hypothetical protein
MNRFALFGVVPLRTIELVAILVVVLCVYLARRNKPAAAGEPKRRWPDWLEKLAGALIAFHLVAVFVAFANLCTMGPAFKGQEIPISPTLIMLAGPTALIHALTSSNRAFIDFQMPIEFALYAWLIVPPSRWRVLAVLAIVHLACGLITLALLRPVMH